MSSPVWRQVAGGSVPPDREGHVKLILASTSSYRRQLLQRLGLPFETASPEVDETRLDGEAPHALAMRLATAKAAAVSAMNLEACVIGSDQVIAIGDQVLSKPHTVQRAIEQLSKLSGDTHHLITAVCVDYNGQRLTRSMTHEMVMRPLTTEEIADYIALDEPLDCAGSYKIEGAGIRLFESLRGDDYTSIIGLPLTLVHRMLRDIGALQYD